MPVIRKYNNIPCRDGAACTNAKCQFVHGKGPTKQKDATGWDEWSPDSAFDVFAGAHYDDYAAARARCVEETRLWLQN